MIYVSEFSKISEEQFNKDFKEGNYLDITLPKRGTTKAAGYDFYCPYDITIKANTPTLIPTGIRCRIDDNWVLMLYPRSSMGFKYGMRLSNSTGVIDADYFDADNEGHIMAKIISDVEFTLHKGDRFMQGVFFKYGITVDDNTEGIRNGGFGSTGK